MTGARVLSTEVDGIPTYHCPGVGGPVRAVLQFRVGHVDEDLPQRGTTHLIEHLALHQFGGDVHHNGFTGPNITGFVVEGSSEKVSSFLSTVAGTLHRLPIDRLETECDVLRAEEAQRNWGLAEELLTWRYGMASYGTSATAEYGVRGADEEALVSWARKYFTRGNAVLWVIGEIPSDLHLELPDGARVPCPEIVELQEEPAWYSSRYQGGAGSTLMRRSPATTAYAALLDRRLKERLRFDSGKSYAPRVDFDRRDGVWAELVFSADALTENLKEVANGVVETLADARDRGFTEDEMVTYRELALAHTPDHRHVEALTVMAAHSDLVDSRIFWTDEETRAETEAVTLDSVNTAAGESWSKVLFAMPGVDLDRPDVTRLSDSSDYLVTGKTYSLREAGEAGEAGEGEAVALVAGDEGLSLIRGEHKASVRIDGRSVLLAWEDGKRALLGHDAFQVVVEPNLWKEGDQIVALLDRAVSAERRISMGSRDPSEIPAVPQTSGKRRGPLPTTLYYVLGLVGILALIAVAIVGHILALMVPVIVLLWRLGRNWLREPS